MTYSRILDPASKLGTHRDLDHYYEQPDFDNVHILRTMDIMKEHYDEYICHLYEKSCNIIKRDTSVCFYDCTNYYFEVETDDEDYVDEVTQSLKKLSEQLKQAVFNDCDYRLLSTGEPVTLKHMKEFDRFDEKNKYLYDDRAYKILNADKAFDVGLYEEKV